MVHLYSHKMKLGIAQCNYYIILKYRWGVLNVFAGYSTQTQYDDEIVSRGAGYLEGALTYRFVKLYIIYYII